MSDQRTVIRAVTIPVSCPVGSDPDGKPWTWQSFDARLNQAFRLATGAANGCIQELFRRDTHGVAKTPDAVKPKGKGNPQGFDPYAWAATCTRCGLQWYEGEAPRNRTTKKKPPQCRCPGEPTCSYPDFPQWKGAKQSLGICLRYSHRWWLGKDQRGRMRRYAAMVTHDQSVLTVKFPFPFPVDADAWKTIYEHGKFANVELTIPGVGSVTLALRTRADFRRQLAMFRQLHEGTATKCEAALYRNKKGDLLLKMVGWFPRRERGPAANVAFVHTDPHSLLVVEINGHRANVTNADHIRREIAKTRSRSSCRQAFPSVEEQVKHQKESHGAFLQRSAEDKKREVRMDRRQRSNFGEAIEDRCDKQNHRMDTAIKQIAAQVARMCQRQGVGLVAYDDADAGFIPQGFNWSALKTRLQQILVGEMDCEWVDGQFTHLKEQKEKEQWLLSQTQNTALAGKRAVANRSRSGSHPAVTPNSPPTPSRRPKRSPASARP